MILKYLAASLEEVILLELAMKVRLNVSPFWSADLTVTQAAKDLKINPKTLTAIRKGTEKGDWATLVKLSRYFNVSIDQLLEIEEDKK